MSVYSSDIDKKPSVEHIDIVHQTPSQIQAKNDQFIADDALDATTQEHELSFFDAVKYHKAAIGWSIVLSATIIMEGYDNILMTSFFGYPAFQKKYGVETSPGNYEMEGRWQVALGAASAIGLMFGVIANGYLTERFGHRRVIMAALVVMSAFIFITFFAPSVEVLFVGQILCGLPWGVFATMGPTYSSEVCPMALRGYLTAYVNMCWATGQLIAAGVLQALVNNDNQWSYRIPFAVQWVWPVPLFILTWLAPDSPWWLVRKGRTDDAKRSIERLSAKSIHHRANQTVAMIIHTNNLEKHQHNSVDNKRGFRGFQECFESTNMRRTEIACVVFISQQTCGAAMAYSPSYFFRQAGLNATQTYNLNLGITGIAFVGTACSWILLNKLGRRTIYLTGFTFITLSLLLIGILTKPVAENHNVVWGQCALTVVWVLSYALTLGPITFTIVAEISATRVRAQTVALARCCYHIAQLVCNVVEPYLINPKELDLKGNTAFVWFVTAFLTLTWAYFRLPETKNRTYEELDIIFDRRISARQFSKYVVDDSNDVN